MRLFKKKEEPERFPYNPERHRPLLKCNTCNRDMVFGFVDKETGAFHELALIRSEEELGDYLHKYGLEHAEKKY